VRRERLHKFRVHISQTATYLRSCDLRDDSVMVVPHRDELYRSSAIVTYVVVTDRLSIHQCRVTMAVTEMHMQPLSNGVKKSDSSRVEPSHMRWRPRLPDDALPRHASASLGETFGFRLPERLLDGKAHGEGQPHLHIHQTSPRYSLVFTASASRYSRLEATEATLHARAPLPCAALFFPPRQPACLLVAPRI
jgi:hypothetical protein